MAINVTRWSPDTCNCVIEYSWDSDVPQDSRTHDLHKVVNQCEEHAGIEKHHEVHKHVMAENQTKNNVVAKVFDRVPRLKKQHRDEKGNMVHELDPDVNYRFEFTGKDHNRKLKVAFDNAGLTKNEKTALKQALTTLDKPVTLE